MGGKAASLVLVVLLAGGSLLLPNAVAQSDFDAGPPTLEVSAGCSFPVGTQLDGVAYAAYWRDSQSLRHLEVQADHARLVVVEVYVATAGNEGAVRGDAELSRKTHDYALQNLTLNLAPRSAQAEHAGWLGAYPSARGHHLQAKLARAADFSPAAHQRVGDTKTAATDGGDPQRYIYAQDVDSAHLSLKAVGSVSLSGAWALTLYGPDLHLHDDERGDWSIETGRMERTPGHTLLRWAYLETPEGTLDVTSEGPAHLALGPTLAQGDQTLSLNGSTPETVGGPFRVGLEPAQRAGKPVLLARVYMEDGLNAEWPRLGRLSLMPLGEFGRVATSDPVRVWGSAILLLGVGLALGVGSTYLAHHPARRDAITPRMLAANFESAAEGELLYARLLEACGRTRLAKRHVERAVRHRPDLALRILDTPTDYQTLRQDPKFLSMLESIAWEDTGQVQLKET